MPSQEDSKYNKMVFTQKSRVFLDRIQSKVRRMEPLEIADHIAALVQNHDNWRKNDCLNMNPAESSLSHRARDLLASDMASRLTEGLPGDKSFPHYRQTRFIDEIEGIIIALARKQFGARYVEWRPVSTSMANAAAFFPFLKPGDRVFAQGMEAGGNSSYQSIGPLGLTGAEIIPIPPKDETFEIDVDWIANQAKILKPKMIVIGGSKVLYPYPLAPLRDIADSVGAMILYDAAHLGLLISAGNFQKPLAEGAHIVTISTHKIMYGPVGGFVLTNDDEIADRIISLTFPAFLQTRDQNKYAALAVTLAELEKFGPALATNMVANANCLAEALAKEGFNILMRDDEYTRTHQIFLKLGDAAQTFEWRCQAANILIPDCALTGDTARGHRTGARIATHELTRQGMGPADMAKVASLIGRASREANDFSAIATDVRELIAQSRQKSCSFYEQ